MNLSTNQNKLDFLLEYDHNWTHHPLDIVIKIDDRPIHVDLSGKQQVSVAKKINLQNGDHLLSMTITNKTMDSVIIDDLNQVVKDSYIKIKNLSMNDIVLNQMVETSSKFVGIDQQILHSPGGIYNNGTWKFEFRTPLYDWILDILFK